MIKQNLKIENIPAIFQTVAEKTYLRQNITGRNK